MCGIFAYIGNRQAAEILITALKRLEYRGYDSSGIGIHCTGKPITVRKKVGKVRNLEAICGDGGVAGTQGIAHTRWATHGEPSDRNSHPHATYDCSIAVVHNGIIENYSSLKEGLVSKGYKFTSDTDTEVLAHLVREVRTQMPMCSWTQVVAVALSLTEGAYGVVFMFQDDPDLLIGARKGSPLILGIGGGDRVEEHMLSSDASAIIEHTKKVVYLRDGEIVEVRRNSYNLGRIDYEALRAKKMSKAGAEMMAVEDNPIVALELSLEQIEKGEHAHFMLKEIMDQPRALRQGLRGRLVSSANPYGTPSPAGTNVTPTKWNINLGCLQSEVKESGKTCLDFMAQAKRIVICACGTSWHSALIGKYLFESLARIRVEVEYASEFRYRNPLLSSDDVIVAMSQSGETADTLEAIKIAKQYNALTFGIVNAVGSTIARETDAGIYLHVGPEIGVASTKAFTGQVIALCMLVLRIALHRQVLSPSQFDSLCADLDGVPGQIENMLQMHNKQTKIVSKYFRFCQNVIFCSSGINFPVALEGALKLKEISYIHAEGMPAAEIKYGPFALVGGFMPVVAIATREDQARYAQVKKNLTDLKSKHASLIIVTEEGNTDFDEMADFVINIPKVNRYFEPILATVPLQLLSYHVAVMRGCDVDQPRNLAKSVTVE